jgi:hypothetical protein
MTTRLGPEEVKKKAIDDDGFFYSERPADLATAISPIAVSQ